MVRKAIKRFLTPFYAQMRNFLGWINDELGKLEEAGLTRRRRCVTPLANGWCEVDGRKLRNMSSNDTLNLAHDTRLIEAARKALEESGTGARASALVTGRTDWHARLEEQLAEFEGQEAAVLFPTGYAANLGTMTALTGAEDVLFSDRLNHASLIDGCRLSKAECRIYPHGDVGWLEQELEKSAGFRRRFIVTDSLFSMDGDVAPLVELSELADRFDATLIVDEAHATGVFGEHGRGVAEWKNVEGRGIVRVGTLSKALGSLGGFVAGEKALIDWLWNRARTQIYSTALPPSACAAASKAVEIISEEPWRRERVLELSGMLRQRLQEVDLEIVPGSVGPIVPVILNDPRSTLSAARALEAAGFLVAAIRPPTVPEGSSRLRITVCCAHSEEDIDRLVEALVGVLKPQFS